jgi:long-chain acyl-CoA synthetase
MLSHESIKRLLIDLSLKATDKPFMGVVHNYQGKNFTWKDDIGLDSLEMLHFSSLTNVFFNLFELEQPPYLLQYPKVDEWVELIFEAHKNTIKSLNFFTSGTTGQVKTINHLKTFLAREIDFLASLFSDAKQIIPYVSSCSIYGFLLTVGLPERLKIPVVYPSEINIAKLVPHSLIVATPFHWQFLMQNMPLNSTSTLAVSSGSKLFDALYQQVERKGITLTELYGATETTGVAYRKTSKDSFTLFPYWDFHQQENSLMVKDKESGELIPLMDNLHQLSANRFKLLARKDNKINVAGNLTDLDYITKTIKSISNIKDCVLSAKAVNNELMIQAYITLTTKDESSETEIKRLMKLTLKPHEIPRNVVFS